MSGVSPTAFPATPLVGRDRELALLRAHLDAVIAGRGGLVLIGGEAGIGKTALAETLLIEAAARGALVLVGRCYDLSETSPYGPWIEALARMPAGEGPHAVPDLGGGGGSASQAALVAVVRGFLEALAAHRPVVLLLDDLHWADPASLDLLRVVARGLADLPLLALVTYRVDELTRHHPLYALLPLLVREARAWRLDPRPLHGADLRLLVRGYGLSAPDEARLVGYLGGRAEGNPFYTEELLRALEGEGILAPDGAAWQLGDLGEARVPPLLRQVIDARLDRLGEAGRALLAVAAIIGQAIPLALWATVAEVDEATLLDSVERAAGAHVLVESTDGSAVRFAHALIREALYQGLGALRRRALHRRVADALLATPRPDPDAVAYHLRQADDPRAATWLLAAGDRARRAYATVSAAARYEAALGLLELAGAGARERGWAVYWLARVNWLADPGRALAEAAQAAPLAEEAGDRALQACVAFQHGFLLCMVGAIRRGLAAIAAMLPLIAALPAAEARVFEDAYGPRYPESLLAEWFAWSGRFVDALPPGRRAVAGRPPGAPQSGVPALSYAAAYIGLAVAHAGLGDPVAAGRAFAEARACNRALDHAHQLGMNARQELGWFALAYQPDRLADRRALADEAEQAWARARGARPDIIPASATLPLLVREGRWAEARAIAEQLHATRSSGWSRVVANATLASLDRETGDPATAWARATEDLADGPDTAPGDCWLLDALPALRLAALIAIDRGDADMAHAWLACHDRWLAWSGSVLGRVEGALGWAAYHRAAGDPGQAYHDAERARVAARAPRQPLALLAAHRLLGELDTVAARQGAAERHLAAALTLAEACAAPYEQALTLLALAELRTASGERERAVAVLADARMTLTALGAAPVLARADALAARLAAPLPAPALPFGLTAREAEVLALLAAGLTDPQIAARLFVSRHTVNGHLKAIYGKLGVTNRAAATRLTLEHRLD